MIYFPFFHPLSRTTVNDESPSKPVRTYDEKQQKSNELTLAHFFVAFFRRINLSS
jgi:hypothetical protein